LIAWLDLLTRIVVVAGTVSGPFGRFMWFGEQAPPSIVLIVKRCLLRALALVYSFCSSTSARRSGLQIVMVVL
jgi:hypothetical protein